MHHLKRVAIGQSGEPILTAHLISAPVYFHNDELGDERQQERRPGNGESDGGPVRKEPRRGAAGEGAEHQPKGQYGLVESAVPACARGGSEAVVEAQRVGQRAEDAKQRQEDNRPGCLPG